MKVGSTTTKTLVETVLHARKSNIVMEARWVIINITIKFHFVHVYGHQNNSFHFNELSQIYQLNVICGNMKK